MIQNILRKGESSTRRSSYLRSSFLLIKAFMYSESFFCISARRSQALPLPTGVLRKHRNRKTSRSSGGGHGGTGSFIPANDPSAQCVYEALLTHRPRHHTPMWGALWGLVGARGVLGQMLLRGIHYWMSLQFEDLWEAKLKMSHQICFDKS